MSDIKPDDPAAKTPCLTCGRSRETNLSMLEAQAVFGYAKAACLVCLLTVHKRDQETR